MKLAKQMVAAMAAWALSGAALAQQPAAWPQKPVRYIVSFAPGGPADVVARLVGAKLTEALGQQLVVENRAGAGGNIAAALVARAAPDGYTALVTTSAFAVNVTLYANPGYEEREFIPLINAATQPNLIFVNAGFPAKTLAELITIVKNEKLAFASPGLGTTPHLTGENLFRSIARADITPIHFAGAAPAATAMLSGEPPIGSAPSERIFSMTSGVFSALIISALSAAMIAGGVLAGATRPYQPMAS